MAVQQLFNRVGDHANTRSAFELDLKNELPPKARRFEVLLTDKDYRSPTNTPKRLTTEKANALAHINICITNLV